MKVSQIMHKNPVCVTTTETLLTVANHMKDGDFGAVIVKEGEKALGVLTDRDIVTRALTKNENLANIKVKDVMTKKLVTCNADDTLETVTSKMQKEKIRRIVVLDPQQKAIGILSLGDIALAEKGTGTAYEVLKTVSQH